MWTIKCVTRFRFASRLKVKFARLSMRREANPCRCRWEDVAGRKFIVYGYTYNVACRTILHIRRNIRRSSRESGESRSICCILNVAVRYLFVFPLCQNIILKMIILPEFKLSIYKSQNFIELLLEFILLTLLFNYTNNF